MTRTIDLMRVKTTLGERIYPLDTRMYSYVSPGVYHRKYVPDINEDEMVLWHNESIETSLRELEPELKRSPRYVRAEEAVFLVNGKGMKIPRFRAELARALVLNGTITMSESDLERKIMKDDDDFTGSEYNLMADYLARELDKLSHEDGTPSRKMAQIKSWLRGTTPGPSTGLVFYSLAIATGSKTFEDWFDGVGETGSRSEGFWREYRFYTVLRQGIMRYVSKGRGELKERSGATVAGYEDLSSFRITPEIQIVLNQFIGKINEEFSRVRVLQVERLSVAPQEVGSAIGEQRKKLSKGMYTGARLEDASILSLSEMISGANFFTYIADSLLEQYVREVVRGRSKDEELSGSTLLRSLVNGNYYSFNTFIGILTHDVTVRLGLGTPNELMHSNLSLMKNSSVRQDVRALASQKNIYEDFKALLAERIAEKILEGEIDAAIEIPQFGTYGVFERLAGFSNAIPRLFQERVAVIKQLGLPKDWFDIKLKRDFELRYRKLTEQLSRKYDFPDEKHTRISFLVADFIYSVGTQIVHTLPRSIDLNPQSFNAFMQTTAPIFEVVRDPVRFRGNAYAQTLHNDLKETYLTQDDCARILRAHDLEYLLRLIPASNFVFEEGEV